MGKSMKVDFSEIAEQKIFDTVRSLGYGIYSENENINAEEKGDGNLFFRFIISVVLLVALMYVSMGHMFMFPLPSFLNPHNGNAHYFSLYQAILSTAIIYINFHFFLSGASAVLRRVPNMDTLVALGSGVSYVYSIVLTILIFIGTFESNSSFTNYFENLYFESAAMILVLVTVGKWLEEKSKKRTGSEVEKLLKLMPDLCLVERNGKEISLSIKDLQVGDFVIVRQGEYIPVDGKIVFGTGAVDKSAITGESLPVEVTIGDYVTSASLVKNGDIKLKAEKIGEESTLSKIIKMVKAAGASKAPLQKLADKIAGIFVPVVCCLSILTFALWCLIDGAILPAHSITFAICVLVVSCPCALGLATPVAITTASGRGAALGILYKDAQNLQKLTEVNVVLLDKTATLTIGKPQVKKISVFENDEEFIKKLLYGIEKNSNHPFAKCIMDFCQSGVEVENFKYVLGEGATAEFEGKNYFLGNEKLVGSAKIKRIGELGDDFSGNSSVVYLADENKVLAAISISDKIKTESKETILNLKDRGMKVAMLTGDSKNAANEVAKSLGIDEFLSEIKPEDKLQAVENLQKIGATVAMVGDGINDAPALKQADVGIAIGSGTDVAIDSAGIVLVSNDLRALDTAFELSKITVRNIKQNLFWAFFYNAAMIPIAAGCFSFFNLALNPMIAAACMSISSLFVVGNALRILTFKNKKFADDKNDLLSEENEFMKKIVTVEGMCCEHCAKRVEDKLTAVEGVISVDVKLKKKLVILRSREMISDDIIKNRIVEAGYSVVSIENK